MTLFVDQDISLGESESEGRTTGECSKSYSLEIAVYHRLTVHIYQPPSYVFELLEPISDGCDQGWV